MVAPSGPVVPGYAPVTLLVALEALAALAAVVIYARWRVDVTEAVRLCPRCQQLHKRTEAIGRVADAVAVGTLSFVVALPFLVAGYESGFSLSGVALAISAIVAVLGVGAEVDWLVRAAAQRIWPRLTWIVAPTRIVGGGARWLGVLFAWYLFRPGFSLVRLFGDVGQHLVSDLSSTWIIYVAAALLILSAVAAIASRWLAPLILFSQPIPLATRRDPHGASA